MSEKIQSIDNAVLRKLPPLDTSCYFWERAQSVVAESNRSAAMQVALAREALERALPCPPEAWGLEGGLAALGSACSRIATSTFLPTAAATVAAHAVAALKSARTPSALGIGNGVAGLGMWATANREQPWALALAEACIWAILRSAGHVPMGEGYWYGWSGVRHFVTLARGWVPVASDAWPAISRAEARCPPPTDAWRGRSLARLRLSKGETERERWRLPFLVSAAVEWDNVAEVLSVADGSTGLLAASLAWLPDDHDLHRSLAQQVFGWAADTTDDDVSFWCGPSGAAVLAHSVLRGIEPTWLGEALPATDCAPEL